MSIASIRKSLRQPASPDAVFTPTELLDAVDASGLIDDRGYGPMLEIFAPDYPAGFPGRGNNGNGFHREKTPIVRKYRLMLVYADGIARLRDGADLPEVSGHALPGWPFDPRGQKGNKLIAWQVYGFATPTTMANTKKGVSAAIKKLFAGARCVQTGSRRGIEIDHKFGRTDQVGYSNAPTKENHQPLCKLSNNEKREACKQCRLTNIRFDAAKELGLPVSYVEGGPKFEHNGLGCRGCYWFDILAFLRSMVKPRRGA